MGVLSQGTHIWIKHGKTPTLTRANCIKEFSWGDDSMGETDDTCLDGPAVKTSFYTSVTPGEGNMAIDTDPENASHIELLDLAAEKEVVEIYVGWSDGEGVPTLAPETGVVTLPDTRTWSSAIAQLRKNPVTISPDALNRHAVPFKRRTEVIDAFKA